MGPVDLFRCLVRRRRQYVKQLRTIRTSNGDPIDGEDTGFVTIDDTDAAAGIQGSQFGLEYQFYEGGDEPVRIDGYQIAADGDETTATTSAIPTTSTSTPTTAEGSIVESASVTPTIAGSDPIQTTVTATSTPAPTTPTASSSPTLSTAERGVSASPSTISATLDQIQASTMETATSVSGITEVASTIQTISSGNSTTSASGEIHTPSTSPTLPSTLATVAASGAPNTALSTSTTSLGDAHTEADGSVISATTVSEIAIGSIKNTATSSITSATTTPHSTESNTTTAIDSGPIEAISTTSTPGVATETSASSAPNTANTVENVSFADTTTSSTASLTPSSSTTPDADATTATTPGASITEATATVSKPSGTIIVDAGSITTTSTSTPATPGASTATTTSATTAEASTISATPTGVKRQDAETISTVSNGLPQSGDGTATSAPTSIQTEADGSPTPPSAVRTAVPDDAFPEIRYAYLRHDFLRFDLDGDIEYSESHDDPTQATLDADHNRYELDGDTLRSYDPDNTLRWEVDDIAGDDYEANFVAVGGDSYCYVGTQSEGASTTGYLKRIDLSDGSVLWSDDPGASRYHDGAVDADGNCYVSGDSSFQKIDSDGTRVWESEFDDGEPEDPFVGPDNEYCYVYDGDDSQHVRVKTDTGDIDSTRPSDIGIGSFSGLRALDADGYLYLRDTDNYAFKYDWDADERVWVAEQTDDDWSTGYLSPHPDPFTGPLIIEREIGFSTQTFALRELDPDDGSIEKTIDSVTFDDDGDTGNRDVLAHPRVGGNPHLWEVDIEQSHGLQSEQADSATELFTPTVTASSSGQTEPTPTTTTQRTVDPVAGSSPTVTPTASASTPSVSTATRIGDAGATTASSTSAVFTPDGLANAESTTTSPVGVTTPADSVGTRGVTALSTPTDGITEPTTPSGTTQTAPTIPTLSATMDPAFDASTVTTTAGAGATPTSSVSTILAPGVVASTAGATTRAVATTTLRDLIGTRVGVAEPTLVSGSAEPAAPSGTTQTALDATTITSTSLLSESVPTTASSADITARVSGSSTALDPVATRRLLATASPTLATTTSLVVDILTDAIRANMVTAGTEGTIPTVEAETVVNASGVDVETGQPNADAVAQTDAVGIHSPATVVPQMGDGVGIRAPTVLDTQATAETVRPDSTATTTPTASPSIGTADTSQPITTSTTDADSAPIDATATMLGTLGTGRLVESVAATKHRAIAVPNIALEFTPRTRRVLGGSNDASLTDTSNDVVLDHDSD